MLVLLNHLFLLKRVEERGFNRAVLASDIADLHWAYTDLICLFELSHVHLVAVDVLSDTIGVGVGGRE